MPQVVFIGLGLNDEAGLSLEGLEEARRARSVFAEFYTNIMPKLKMNRLEELLGKKITVLTRTQLEDENGEQILQAAKHGDVALLVPGDPMIATTHVSLRLLLAQKGITTRIVHNASIVSAIPAATGLQGYKFGKSVTLPHEGPVPGSVMEVIRENRARGLHTLLLLDVKADQGKYLTVVDALTKLVEADRELDNWLGVGAARVGSSDQMVKAARVRTLKTIDFGSAPQVIVFPGKLHFIEADALKAFCDATDMDLEGNL